jgi:hypothetical protein
MIYGSGSIIGIGIFGWLFALVVLLDLILVGIWLWKQIEKESHVQK